MLDLNQALMKLQIKQEDVYEDLSQSLMIIKKKLKLFVKKHDEDHIITRDTQHSKKQDQITLRLEELINKYKQAQISSLELINITKRFISRVKEVIGQVINCISKHQVHLLIKIKRIQLFTSRCVSKDNYGLAIASLLQVINTITNQSLSSYPFSHSKHDSTPEERCRLTNNYNSTLCTEQSPTKKKVSEVTQMLNQVQKYNKVMDVDTQYFKGKYFDLKQDNQDGMLIQILNRNRYIKSVMTNYEREHIKYKSKETNRRYESQGKIKAERKKRHLKESQQIRMTDCSQDTVLRSVRTISKQNVFNRTFHINDQKLLSQQEGMQTFRFLYQQKMNERKNMIVKINNMVLPEPNKNIQIKNSNAKKVQFCKKSLEQERYRYKYFIRKQTKCNNASKCKTINPEFVCTPFDSN